MNVMSEHSTDAEWEMQLRMIEREIRGWPLDRLVELLAVTEAATADAEAAVLEKERARERARRAAEAQLPPGAR